ncbi:hypothetical protein ACT7DM_08825 [Bacillus cereus]
MESLVRHGSGETRLPAVRKSNNHWGDERNPPMIKVSLYCKGDWYMSQVSEKAVSFEPEEKKEKKNGK